MALPWEVGETIWVGDVGFLLLFEEVGWRIQVSSLGNLLE